MKCDEKSANKTVLLKWKCESAITMAKLESKVKFQIKNEEDEVMTKKTKKNSLFFNDNFGNTSKSKTLKFVIFEYLSYFLIVIDTVILSVDSNERTKYELKILLCIDFVCLLYFFIEIKIRLFLQRSKFFTSLTNLMDLVLFVVNISILIYLKAKNIDIFNDFFEGQYYSIYSIIRSIQIARIYRLLISEKLSKGIATMALEMIKILKEVMNFLIILCIFILLMSLIGRDLFVNAKIMQDLGNKLIEEEIHRMNLNNILRSVMTNLMIFFDEDWHLIMINHMKAYGATFMVYFTINVLILTMFLNKFFLALLINKLIESKNMRNLIKSSAPFKHFIPFSKLFLKWKLLYSNYSQKILDVCNLKILDHAISKKYKFHLFDIFKKYGNYLKKINSKELDKFMFFVCCFSLLLVALNDPFQPIDSTYNRNLKLLDIPVLIIFLFEILVLSITEKKGLFQEKTIFRLGICVVYIIYFISDIHILKIFVTLRFILIIQFYKGLRKAVMALLYSLWDIFQLLVFFFLFILLFAAIGVKLHKGAFTKCQNLSEEDLEKIQTKTDCLDFGGDWINSDFNFDNILKAIDTLFVIANSSGWLPVM